MKKGWLAVLLVCAAVLMGGCSGGARERRYFAYLEGEVCLSLSGTLDGMDFSALLNSAKGSAGDGRGYDLTYLSPEALAGVRVRIRPGEAPLVSLGELEAQGEAYAPLVRVGELLLRESAVTASRREGQLVVLETADGATRWHDAATGSPVRLRCQADGRVVDVTLTAPQTATGRP
jgi:hypothetical protein